MHADSIQLSRLCGANFREAGEVALLSDGFIAANNSTQAAFRAAIGNETNVHAEIIAQRGRLQRAVDYDGSTYGIGDITDVNLPSTSTLSALIALTQEPTAGTARQIILE